MIGIACMCFVSARGELVGSPRVGVSKVQRRGRGAFLLDARLPPGAAVRISALPPGYHARWAPAEPGIKVEIFDHQAKSADHGFALVIEAPEVPPTPRRLDGPSFDNPEIQPPPTER